MADENDIHARLAVVENTCARLEKSISEIWDKITPLEICTASLPKIEHSLDEISKEVKTLQTAMTTRNAQDCGKNSAWLSLREWAIVAAALAALILEHFVIK